MRYYNNAPWFYKKEFEVPEEVAGQNATLRFEGVDYFCKVWLNDQYLGEHEGYFSPFEFEVTDLLNGDGKNTLVVKVWSPWDTSELSLKVKSTSFDINIHGMMKGTYEHADGFIQRDVNPVGIWGDVKLIISQGIRICEEPFIRSTLSENHEMANVQISVPLLADSDDRETTLRCRLIDESTGLEEAVSECTTTLQSGVSTVELEMPVINPKLWNTWDRGTPNLYSAKIEVWSNDSCIQTVDQKFGIRKIEITRTKDETTFILNDKRIYVRGTSYFPDIYVSNMNKERYSRDLKAMKGRRFQYRQDSCSCCQTGIL